MTRRRISSRWTLFHKVIFPVCWIGAFVVGTALMFLVPADASNDLQTMRWFFLGMTILGGSIILGLALPLKYVDLGERSFFVRARSREIEIPFQEVADVTGSRFVNPPRLTLHLRRAGELGDRIVFLPPLRLYFGWKAHPLAKELRERIAHAPDR